MDPLAAPEDELAFVGVRRRQVGHVAEELVHTTGALGVGVLGAVQLCLLLELVRGVRSVRVTRRLWSVCGVWVVGAVAALVLLLVMVIGGHSLILGGRLGCDQLSVQHVLSVPVRLYSLQQLLVHLPVLMVWVAATPVDLVFCVVVPHDEPLAHVVHHLHGVCAAVDHLATKRFGRAPGHYHEHSP